MQPLFGRFYLAFPTKWTYILAFGFFELGSLICAVAPTSTALIIGRALAGCGAGGVLSGSYVIVAQIIPLRIRPAYIAAVSMMFSLGAIVAPLIGGALTERVTWRWCFYLNLPVGLPVTVGMVFLFKPPKQKGYPENNSLRAKVLSLDLPGAALLLGAAVMLFYALQRAADGTHWSSSLVIGLLVGAGVTIIVFAGWQGYQGEKAFIIPRILKQRTVFTAGIANIAMYAALVAYVYFLPIYFQAIKGVSVVGSAVDLLPLVVTCSFFSIVAGILVTKIGYFTPPAVVGLSLTMIGAGLMTTIDGETSTADWAGYQILLGVGLGLALQSGFFGMQAILPPEEIPIGTSLMTFCQNLGGALGVSIGNAVLLDVLRERKQELLEIGVNIDEVIGAGATAFRAFVRGDVLEPLLSAYKDALKQTFVMAAAFTGLALLSSCFMELRKATEHQNPRTSSEDHKSMKQ